LCGSYGRVHVRLGGRVGRDGDRRAESLHAHWGAVFELALARPIWNLTDRFASSPALTLESCVGDEVRAVGGFNADAIAQALAEAKLITIAGAGEGAPGTTASNITSVIQSVLAAQLVAKSGILDAGTKDGGQAAPAATQVASPPRRS
jgi:hypothetical protein